MKRLARILFLCRENSCRSQMAEAFAWQYGKGSLEAWSAGSTPRGEVDARTIEVMRERGIELSQHTSKGLGELPDVQWDVVVTMGCGDACPAVAARHRLDWKIPDPKGQALEGYRRVRDAIEDAVKVLLAQLSDFTAGADAVVRGGRP